MVILPGFIDLKSLNYIQVSTKKIQAIVTPEYLIIYEHHWRSEHAALDRFRTRLAIFVLPHR
jgi:hypothetical protein